MCFKNSYVQHPTIGQLYAVAHKDLEDYPADTASNILWHVYRCDDCQKWVQDMKEQLPSLQVNKDNDAKALSR